MSASSATEDADAARAELAACEKEISTVKALLRSLGSSGGGGDADDATNRLTVSWIKVRNHRINTCSMNLREREPLGCGRISYSVTGHSVLCHAAARLAFSACSAEHV